VNWSFNGYQFPGSLGCMETKTPSAKFEVTDQTKIRRKPERGSYDRAQAYEILDEALTCSVGFALDGQPFVIPMVFARWNDSLVLHGPPASRMLKAATAGVPVCVTVTLIDGLVLARSTMHHSMNYRSVVALGEATELTDPKEKLAALERVVEHMLPGRSASARPPNDKELASTRVLTVPLERVSIKVRAGGPLDDEEDLAVPCWAGVLPLALTAQAAIPDAAHAPLVPEPASLASYSRGAR
jgi:nitroimidazol reductase NimA-like FMN-containing flavoprotein (pyridoxamine 5'-phosphate oxidase superfamily)